MVEQENNYDKHPHSKKGLWETQKLVAVNRTAEKYSEGLWNLGTKVIACLDSDSIPWEFPFPLFPVVSAFTFCASVSYSPCFCLATPEVGVGEICWNGKLYNPLSKFVNSTRLEFKDSLKSGTIKNFFSRIVLFWAIKLSQILSRVLTYLLF